METVVQSLFQSRSHEKLLRDVPEGEVISLELPFPRVSSLLMLEGKNRFFIKMDAEEVVNTMLGYYSQWGPRLCEHPLYIQFSNFKELRTNSSIN